MLRKLSIASGLRSSSGPGRDSKQFHGKVVKYTPYSARHAIQDDDDLDEVISVAAVPENVRYGGSTSGANLNGPRVVPGIITSTGPEKSHILAAATYGQKIPPTPVPSSSGMAPSTSTRKPSTPGLTTIAGSPPHSSARAFAHESPPLTGPKSIRGGEERDTETDRDSDIKHPLIETISSKVGTGPAAGSSKTANGSHRAAGPGGAPKQYQHRPSCATDEATHKRLRDARRKEIKRELEKWDTAAGGSGEKSGCNWSFVFDPSGRLCYYWSMIVSLAFLYNFWVIMYRFAFEEINERTMSTWLTLDGISDFIYILDIAVHFRTGYLEEGVLQTEGGKLRAHYMNSTMFYIDCLCLLPLDFLYLSIGFNSMLRCFRLVKIYRFWSFLDRTERHTNYPNVFRTISLSHYILVIFHWNACFYHLISVRGGFGSRDWFAGSRASEECSDVDCDYLHAFYWSTLALTTIGDLPRPRTKGEYFFLIIELVAGLFLLATVLGHVANIVTNVSAARKEFQAKLDAVKTYMRMRHVPDHLKIKVIKWFDYLWLTQKSSDEDKSVGFLPAKLKAEIAIHVHLDTLKRVEIFQNTEAGFLCALVLRLRPVLFSPGDYVCRKGEVGKEMYIVNRGRLQVVTDNGKTVLATLRAGSYFGEISILNMGTAGNRRTASVKSVGYSDLFCLSKTDMWDVLKDYPAARVRLESIAVKRLEKYRKDPLKQISMGRSRSTPGLVESQSQLPLTSGQALSMQASARQQQQSASAGTLLTEQDQQSTTNEQSQPPPIDSEQASSLGSRAEQLHQVGQQQPGPTTMFMAAPTFGVTPATPTIHAAPQVPPMPAQYFVTLPVPGGPTAAWYERRTSQPQTPLEAMMAPLSGHVSPIPGVLTPSDRGSLSGSGLVAFRAISPAQSAPHLAPEMMGLKPMASALSPSPSQLSGGEGATATDGANELLVAEIKRLRERLQTLESENQSMTIKLSQQQSDVENRLAEIEMQFGKDRSGASSAVPSVAPPPVPGPSGQQPSAPSLEHQASTTSTIGSEVATLRPDGSEDEDSERGQEGIHWRLKYFETL